jgi:hypothetical protein
MFATRARLLLATVWAGSLWTIGYLVAPTLFSTLADPKLAGNIAGSLFRIEAWLALLCGALLLALMWKEGFRRKRLLWLVVAMLACTLIGYFSLQPFMASLREAMDAGGAAAAELRTRFGVLHGVSSVFYLLQSLLAIGLVLDAG